MLVFTVGVTGPGLLFKPGITQQRRCQGRLLGKDEVGGRVDEKQVTCGFSLCEHVLYTVQGHLVEVVNSFF